MIRQDPLAGALSAFGLAPTTRPLRLQRGALNRNYRVESADGRFFLRRHRESIDRDAVAQEHAVILRALELGIPAVQPVACPSGATVVESGGAWWSCFPWIDGRQLMRGRTSRADARALGELLGLIHGALAGETVVDPLRLTWDTAASLERLERIATAATRANDPASAESVHERIRLLEQGDARPPECFDALPLQLCHGDFHDRQVIFAPDGPRALAVVDWEMASARPRTWELIRCLVFAWLDRQPTLEAFCEGYAKHVRIGRAEAELGVELWWQGRLHETWALEEYFLKGNQRVRRFFPDGFRHLRDVSEPRYREQLALAITNAR